MKRPVAVAAAVALAAGCCLFEKGRFGHRQKSEPATFSQYHQEAAEKFTRENQAQVHVLRCRMRWHQERVEDPPFQAQVVATGLACAEAGIGYRVLSEPDRQLLANVRWLAGFRERPPDPDGERARMLARSAAGSCTIGELVSGAREPMLARPVLMNLLWAGDALLDVSAPIGEDSVVWARLQVAG